MSKPKITVRRISTASESSVYVYRVNGWLRAVVAKVPNEQCWEALFDAAALGESRYAFARSNRRECHVEVMRRLRKECS